MARNTIRIWAAGLFLPLLALTAFGQGQADEPIVIEGVVLDADTGEPLPGAHLSIRDGRLGTVSNRSGAFRLVVSKRYDGDMLKVSYIGYVQQFKLLREITGPQTFRLKLDESTLDAVVVKGDKGEALFREAVRRIPDNHYRDPHRNQIFYRIHSKVGGKHAHLSEVAFESYRAREPEYVNQVKLLKVRTIKDREVTDGLNLGTTAKGVLGMDVVNSVDKGDALSDRWLDRHDFDFEELTTVEGREAYRISFRPVKAKRKDARTGYALIDTETMGFLELEINLTDDAAARKKFHGMFKRALLGIFGRKLGMTSYQIKVSYTKTDSRFYLNRVELQTVIHYENKQRGYVADFDTRLDMVVTRLRIEGVQPIPLSEQVQNDDLLASQSGFQETGFWDDYTVILADEDYETIAKVIKERNEKYALKLTNESD